MASTLHMDILLHYKDGCWSSIEGSFTVVRDFTDFCFHSYFSYMDELREKMHDDEQPTDIKLLELPSCLLVSLLSVVVDVPMITLVALSKSPYMLFKGWKRLLEDLIGREGPFLETVCVPFAGLAIILWPLAVTLAVVSAFLSSFFLGLYGGVIVHQESSLQLGLAYIVAIVAVFDEYTNDLLFLREGSCLPRPKYRKHTNPSSGPLERNTSIEMQMNELKNGKVGPGKKLVSERSRTLKKVIQELRPMQVWDWLFESGGLNGGMLLQEGLITVEDIEECVRGGSCRKLSIRLPAYCILQCLVRSAKSDSYGLLLNDEVELTSYNSPKDKVYEWFLGPLLVMKEQIKGLQLNENEIACLNKLIISYKNERVEDWENSGFPSEDKVRIAQLQALLRRLQGIVASMSRIPTFRRRFQNLVKALYQEATTNRENNSTDNGSMSSNRGAMRGKRKMNGSYEKTRGNQALENKVNRNSVELDSIV
ncbi:uncharacterized membrane protein At3g27390 isoform X2 [Amborella trichopoda]|uniref:uncharacterized membrane protein At3g27390 isoform X2 n=1 Tax=Amborella trichopoda TaxID=13333 RepID=UPI0009BECD48|nr:uncharacterized membrane protein At3g27390 isoform X2 [Amborella trichopoda]|eukprot:XP_020531299.1 uncharacterized membrane protein At3g27390 isoform X2 [Amborella trichopoda]